MAEMVIAMYARTAGMTGNRNISKGRRRRILAIAAVIVLLALIVAGCGCVPRHPYGSLLALEDLAAQENSSRLKSRTRAPVVAPVQYEFSSRSGDADLYRPVGTIRAGIVLVPGAAELGKDDPRLVAFANTLARMQFAVLVPNLEQVRDFRMGRQDIESLADALAYAVSRPDLTPGGRVGIAALSYAVGPAVLAALHPEVRGQVRFVVGIGGYYDLTEVVAFFTTGYFRDYTRENKSWHYLPPNTYGKWAFVLVQVERLSDPADRNILEEIARRKLKDPGASVEKMAGQLGPEGRAYYALIENRDPQRTPALIEALPSAVKAELEALDVSRYDLSKLKARLLLFHGRNDNIIPFTESVALAKAAPPGHAHLVLLDGLVHVDLQDISFRDKLRLWCGMDRLLRERSRR